MQLYLYAYINLVQKDKTYHKNRYYRVSYQLSFLFSYEQHYELSNIEDEYNEKVNLLPVSQLVHDRNNLHPESYINTSSFGNETTLSLAEIL